MIESFVENGLIHTFLLCDPRGLQGNIFSRSKYIKNIINKVSAFDPDLLILSSDEDLLSRSLIWLSKYRNKQTVYLSTGTERPMVDKCYKSPSRIIDRVRSQKCDLSLLKKIFLRVIFICRRSIARTIRIMLDSTYLNRFFGLRLVKKRTLSYSYVNFNNFDFALFFSSYTLNAAQQLFNHHNGFHLACSPAILPTLRTKDNVPSSLLVGFSCLLNDEMSAENRKVWVDCIIRICQIKKLDRVTLRLHPRSSPDLLWPMQIKECLNRQLSFKICVDYQCTNPITYEVFCHRGFLSAPSGALLRLSDVGYGGFALCLVGAQTGDFDDSKELLGDMDGIYYVNSADEICDKYLAPPLDVASSSQKISSCRYVHMFLESLSMESSHE